MRKHLFRLALGVMCVLSAVALVAPVAAQQPPTTTAPYWAIAAATTTLWSGPTSDALNFGPAPAGLLLQVVAASGSRVRVWNPLPDGLAWADRADLTPTEEPSATELAALKNFQPWWAMTHVNATAWSASDSDAQAWGEIPQWRYLQVLSPVYGKRVLAVDPRSHSQLFVNANTIGPVGPPPPEYFGDPPSDDEAIGLPGRIIQATDWFERPARVDYFASDRWEINQPVQVEGELNTSEGQQWYRVGDGQYVPATTVRLPQPPDRTFPGRWIDASISEPVMLTAYDDDRPVFSALAVKGRTTFETPTGVFRILRRVANETMDSLTLGIPRMSPDGYYLKDVLFTQYFSGDGAALHYNYWRSNWGYTGSHGCLGMAYDDSLFFWEFATVGTPVYVHD
ncbi:MAG: murein L,D-transpeptidase [Chloroflexi bacterium]|nr:murein L,D-transpeptidase [Chloroflexota bacterium]